MLHSYSKALKSRLQMKKASYSLCYWSDIRNDVRKVNSEIASIIDAISPGKTHSLYVAEYPYGETILEEGTFFFPTIKGETAPLSSERVEPEIQSKFKYAHFGLPSGIVLDKSYELFVDTQYRNLTWLLVTPGSVIALWKTLDPLPSMHPIKMYSIKAGARNIFLLPNVGDLAYHKNLKRDFGIKQPPPKTLQDQWEIFKRIAHHPDVNSNWRTKILFFTDSWIESILHDEKWINLKFYLINSAWNSCRYERNQMHYDLALSWACANRNLKPNPYLLDTLKHLLMMSAGTAPGFVPAIDEIAAPIKAIQKAYVESYGIRKYIPTILHPFHFDISEKRPVYYSMQYPTAMEFSPKSRKVNTTLAELSELKHITEVFFSEVTKNHVKLDGTKNKEIISNLEVEYFHNKPDKHGEILLTGDIPNFDCAFNSSLYECNNDEFAASGHFLRGCISLSKKT